MVSVVSTPLDSVEVEVDENLFSRKKVSIEKSSVPS
jgi:hypothetical protein